MKVGIPREVKNSEFRVAITPAGVMEFTQAGHKVLIEHDAGVGSSISNEEYVAAGARIAPTADDVWGAADLVLKSVGLQGLQAAAERARLDGLLVLWHPAQ